MLVGGQCGSGSEFDREDPMDQQVSTTAGLIRDNIYGIVSNSNDANAHTRKDAHLRT